MTPTERSAPPSSTEVAYRHGPKQYWDDRLKDFWGPHGVGSLAYGRHYNRWLYRVRRQAFFDVCRGLNFDRHAATVLDVGCGTGFYIDQWKALGVKRITGLDFSSVAIARLRRQFSDVDLFEADIAEDLPKFADRQFDIVSAFDVLFHVVDDARYERALRNINSLLRPGGYLLYSDNFLRGSSKQYFDYWKTRSRREVEGALEKTGFEIVRYVPVFMLMNSPVDTQSRLYPRLWELAMKIVSKSEAIGFLVGAAAYPFELVFRKLFRHGPSTKIVVCRKR
jgi:SAM-dependent methyltransferase